MKDSIKEELILSPEERMRIEEIFEKSQAFRHRMLWYRCAIMEVETKFRVLSEEFALKQDRNPIESIRTRLKSPISIAEKMKAKGLSYSLAEMEAHIMDIAGVRVVCSFEEDVYYLAECFSKQNDVEVLSVKDYIKTPKENGYRSYHMVVTIPVFFAEEIRQVPVEIQFRTIAMDFWASLEHTIRYKKDIRDNEKLSQGLLACAASSRAWDGKMEEMLHLMQQDRDAPPPEGESKACDSRDK